MAHDRVDGLALIVSLLALYDIFWRNPTLRQIDISYSGNESVPRRAQMNVRIPTLFLVDTQNNDHLVAPNAD